MNKGKNILIKEYTEPERRLWGDLKTMKVLTPDEFYVYIHLLNVSDDYVPTVRKIAELLNVSLGKAQKISESLRNKGVLEILPQELGTNFVYVLHNVPLDIEKHKEYLQNNSKKLKEIRRERNADIEKEILELRLVIQESNDGAVITEAAQKIIELERKKK